MNTLNATIKMVRFFALAGLVCLSVTSCNLLPDDEPETSTQPDSPTPTIADVYATLSAVKSITYQDMPGFGQVEVDFGVAVGVFFNGVDYDTYLNTGTASCENKLLQEQDNGSYVFIPSQTNATGIDFSGNQIRT